MLLTRLSRTLWSFNLNSAFTLAALFTQSRQLLSYQQVPTEIIKNAADWNDPQTLFPYSWLHGFLGIVPVKVIEQPGTVRLVPLWIALLETFRNCTSQIMEQPGTVRPVPLWIALLETFRNCTSQIMKQPGTVRAVALWIALLASISVFAFASVFASNSDANAENGSERNVKVYIDVDSDANFTCETGLSFYHW